MDFRYAIVSYVKDSTTFYKIVERGAIFDMYDHNQRYYFISIIQDGFHEVFDCNLIKTSNYESDLRVEMTTVVANNLVNRQPEKPVTYVVSPDTIEEDVGDDDESDDDEASIDRITDDVLNVIQWSDYRTATNTLLSTVFTNETLATHTRLGQNYAGLQLDPEAVDRIVSIVIDRCGVEENDVFEVIRKRYNQENARVKYKQKKTRGK
ncbi:PREDICTED: uncharacterized protein LOC108558071 [Nicrophorus vespilloides]|uniref:Uncharacterized protein LOC108558071 n=1 Tax=Nicrophorus vespilloides TaxID=110193 RepID=A0ABM1M715_NICVS|nr:PREDICTED: uncharacterized protein LOC108558071 [Nicrophorus vespilloides]